MKAKVYLNQPLTQERYGLHFDRGVAQTDNEYLINKLKNKGVRLEVIKEEKQIKENKQLKDMKKEELINLAKQKGIEVDIKQTKEKILKLIEEDSTKSNQEE